MKKIIIALVAIMSLSGISAFAGTTLNVDMSFEIPELIELDWYVDGSVVDLTGANAITVAEVMQGYKEGISGGVLECSSNYPYDVTVEANGWTFSGGSGSKPIQTLRVDLDNAGTYPYQVKDSMSPVTILDEQGSAALEQHPVNYKLLLYATEDTPGIYSTTLTYTILVD